MAERHRRQGLAVEWIEWRQVGVLGGSPRILNETPIILQSIKQLPGNKLGASDGDIGHVKDFYFDDQNWAIRLPTRPSGLPPSK
jgi:hypothetical protein